MPRTAIAASDIAGTWEQIVLGYTVVPGYATEQSNPNLQIATTATFGVDGKINGDANSTWTYTAPWMQLKLADGTTSKVYVSRERDWENKVTSTLVFTGLNNVGQQFGERKSK